MTRMPVRCSSRKPHRVFDLVLDDKNRLFIEIKFPGCNHTTKIRIDDYIEKMYGENKKKSN
jgi:hypothetical protein